MFRGSAPRFPSTTEPEGLHQPTQIYNDLMKTSYYGDGSGSSVGLETQFRSILCSLTVLKHKVHEVEALVTMFLSQESQHHVQPFASIGTIIQEIVVNASSMMFNCQQMTIIGNSNGNDSEIQKSNNHGAVLSDFVESGEGKINTVNQGFLDGEGFYNWYNHDSTSTPCNNSYMTTIASTKRDNLKGKERNSKSEEAYDLVEPDAEDLLAKYTHYCHVCGKGFKRDANLRMHMRAHGDEYKSRDALTNPLKNDTNEMKPPRKYSCPQEGCRWNKNHAKFQPLKSIVCVKNHYKRSHCPKMYVCKRCNTKRFSVLSDLRTHEKHCGDRKWQCSCGTSFSRKDKLMGHVSLFVGHVPIRIEIGDDTKLDNHGKLQF